MAKREENLGKQDLIIVPMEKNSLAQNFVAVDVDGNTTWPFVAAWKGTR